MKRIKILYRKNLKMSPEKLAAQAVHAALALGSHEEIDWTQSVVVLGYSDKKFTETIEAGGALHIIRDAGYTEVAPGTITCLAFLENDPREAQATLTTAL